MPVQSRFTVDLRIQAEGLAIVNLRMARIIDGVTEIDEAKVEKWVERYSESWLRSDKRGELDAVLAAMRGKKFDVDYVITNA